MNLLHTLLGIIGLAGVFGAVPVTGIITVFFLVNREKHPKGLRRAAAVLAAAVVLTGGAYLAHFVISVRLYTGFDLEELPCFALTSEDLHDGVWDAAITNTEQGDNRSPQLSWEPVEGAESYAVCMVDESAGDWLHWKQSCISAAGLAPGAAPSDAYVGPYPPSGTHTYTVYVFALRKEDPNIIGTLDINSIPFRDIAQSADVTERGDVGNMIAYGKLTGTYSQETAGSQDNPD